MEALVLSSPAFAANGSTVFFFIADGGANEGFFYSSLFCSLSFAAKGSIVFFFIADGGANEGFFYSSIFCSKGFVLVTAYVTDGFFNAGLSAGAVVNGSSIYCLKGFTTVFPAFLTVAGFRAGFSYSCYPNGFVFTFLVCYNTSAFTSLSSSEFFSNTLSTFLGAISGRGEIGFAVSCFYSKGLSNFLGY